MKALKILALAAALMGAYRAAAGNYTATGTISGVVNNQASLYQCYLRNHHVYLCNLSSRKYLVNGKMENYTMKDGRPVPLNADEYPESMNVDLFVKEQDKAWYIVASGFSDAEKALIKGHKLLTSMVVLPDGKVSEVEFHFVNTSPYQKIPLTTFIKIERQLKQQLYYQKTSLGKQMNYDIVSWSYDFTYTIPNPNPTPPPSSE